MKATISKADLVLGLSRVHRIADRKSPMAVLGNVLISDNDGKMRLSTTDINNSASVTVPAEIDDVGSITVGAKTIFDIAKKLPDDDVTISVDENSWIKLKCKRSKYKIAGISADDFPMLPEHENVEFFELDAKAVLNLINGTSFAMLQGYDDRPHLSGALFEVEEELLRMVATDGHRLGIMELRSDHFGPPDGLSRLIPARPILELKKLLGEKGKDAVEIYAHQNDMIFRRYLTGAKDGDLSEFVMTAKLSCAGFPPYEKVIPSKFEKVVRIDRLSLSDAVVRASMVSRDKSAPVSLSFGKEGLKVTSDSGIGESVEVIDTEYGGQEMTISFNGLYIVEALAALDCESLSIKMNGPTDACVLENEDHRCVIMPQRPD